MGLGLGVVVAGPGRRGLAAPLQLDVFGDHPRAFSFRRPEGDARIGLSFAEWERRFLPLGGIAGKVLSEENYFEEEDNLRFFVDYKARNPTKVVLLHYNGTGRRATDEANRFYNGHWLYYRGTRLTGGVGSSRRDRVLRVTNTSVFSMRRYRSGVADDIVIARMGAGGKPNWESAEHVGLASINNRGRTITVVRGKYGTRRGAFPKGSYVAAHVMTGPYRRNNTPQESIPLWAYNLSTVCPPDRGRRGCADVLADYLREKLGPGGDLELFDGIVFDVLSFRARFGRPMQEVDANADGRADGGVVGGVNVMGLGTNRFLAALRERLPGKILLSDGHEPPEDARGFGLLNGIESEGYPDKYDIQLDHLSRGENVFKYWKQNSAPPPNRQFSFVNFKHKDRRPGRDRNTFVQPNLGQDRSYEKLRLSLASALFTDSAFGFGVGEVWMPPEVVWRDAPGGETRVRIFDELWQGTEQVTNWLGQPLGPAVHLAAAGPRPSGWAWRELDPAVYRAFHRRGGCLLQGRFGPCGVDARQVDPPRQSLSFVHAAWHRRPAPGPLRNCDPRGAAARRLPRLGCSSCGREPRACGSDADRSWHRVHVGRRATVRSYFLLQGRRTRPCASPLRG